MAVVTINPGESIESALRRFKRKVMTEEIIKDAKKHAFFLFAFLQRGSPFSTSSAKLCFPAASEPAPTSRLIVPSNATELPARNSTIVP